MTFIRQANPEDMETVVNMYVDAVNDLRKRIDLPNPDKSNIRAHVYGDFQQAPCFILGDFDGFASMCYGQHPWSDDKYLSTSMVYIKPEKRKYAILELLYSTIKQYADLQGVPYLDHYMTGGEIDERRKVLQPLNLKEYGIIIGYNYG